MRRPARLGGLADYFLLHNREIQTRVDDSVVQTFEGREYPVRRSRGYAPEPMDLGMPVREILACGGELKNTLCLTKDHYAIVSQHIGDLENLETMEFFRETLGTLKRFFRVSPEAVAHDLHPNYMSTRFALEESGLRGDWRAASPCAHRELHGRQRPQRAGDRGGAGWNRIRNRWEDLGRRIPGHAVSKDSSAGDTCATCRLPAGMPRSASRGAARSRICAILRIRRPRCCRCFEEIPERRYRLVEKMIARGIQTVETSSCGRLFDAVASILGIRHETTYEGQAAIELEAAASVATGVYPFTLIGTNRLKRICGRRSKRLRRSFLGYLGARNLRAISSDDGACGPRFLLAYPRNGRSKSSLPERRDFSESTAARTRGGRAAGARIRSVRPSPRAHERRWHFARARR